MRLIALLIAVLIMAAPALAIDVTACGTTLSSSGSTYTLTQNIGVGSGACITISGDNITFDLNNNKITYQSTGAGYAIDNNGSNNTIRNGVIANGSYVLDADFPVVDLNEPAITTGANVTIEEITFNLTSRSTERGMYGIETSGDGALTVANCQFNLDASASGNSGITGVRIGSSSTVTGEIRSNTFVYSGGQVLLSGGLRPIGVHVTSNTNTQAQRLSVYDNNFTFNSQVSDGHAVLVFGGSSIDFYSNTITNHSSDSRMMMSDQSNYCKFYDNSIYITGPDTNGNNVGLRIRSGNGVSNEAYGNTIDCTGSTGSRYGMYIGSSSVESTKIYNNTIIDCLRGIYMEDQNETDLFNNTIYVVAGGTGYWYYIQPTTGDTMLNIQHGYDAIVCRDAGDCRPFYFDDDDGGITNVDICNVEVDGAAIEASDITDPDLADWEILTTGCLGAAPAGSTGGGGGGGGDAVGGYAGLSAAGVVLR